MAESHGFTMDSARRIARTVIEWERSTSSSGEREPRPKRSTRGELPNWNAIAKADIASETLGVVQLADANRATAGTDEITGYNGGPAIAAGRPVIVFPMALPRYDGGEPVNWQIVDPNPCRQSPVPLGNQCGWMLTDTTPQTYRVTFDPASFVPYGSSNDPYDLLVREQGHEYNQQGVDPCIWPVEDVVLGNYDTGGSILANVSGDRLNCRIDIGETASAFRNSVLFDDGTPYTAPFDGLGTRPAAFSSYEDLGMTSGFTMATGVSVGDQIGIIEAVHTGAADDLDLCGRITRLETLIKELVAAGYGEIGASDTIGPDLGAGWTTVSTDEERIPGKRCTTSNPAQWSFDVKGVWLITIYVNLTHNELNAGRTTNIRLWNVTDGQGDAGLPIGIARNVAETSIAIPVMADITAGDVGDTYQIQMGNGDAVTSLVWNEVSIQLNHIGELEGLVL